MWHFRQIDGTNRRKAADFGGEFGKNLVNAIIYTKFMD
jgi:hypothetical protein